jgi:hypothetical protein
MAPNDGGSFDAHVISASWASPQLPLYRKLNPDVWGV